MRASAGGLARLLTERRDRAAAALLVAKQQLADATAAREDLDNELQDAITTLATAEEKTRQARDQASKSEQTIAAAVTAGLLQEGADPAAVDASVSERADAARRTRKNADKALEEIDQQIVVVQQDESKARQRAVTARNDAATAEGKLRQVTRRVDALLADERLLDVVGDSDLDLWTSRSALTDALQHRTETADAETAEARAAVAAARRTVTAVGADGLLPASRLGEEVARRCQDNNEVPAWPGWRWLADTMTPEAAAAFAAARPEIASGVVVAHPDLLDHAIDAASHVDLDVALWVGAVVDSKAAAAARHIGEGDRGTRARVLLPHRGLYDRDAASQLVDAAKAELKSATLRQRVAERRSSDARDMLAALSQLWSDLPDDPRHELAEKIGAARERQRAAEADEQTAIGKVDDLGRQRRGRQRERDDAQQAFDDASEHRRLLVPGIAAAVALADARKQLPALRDTVIDTRRRVEDLQRRKPHVAAAIAAAEERVRTHTRDRDDGAELLRAAGLSATTDGPVPTDNEATIRARLLSIEEAPPRRREGIRLLTATGWGEVVASGPIDVRVAAL